MRRLTTGFAASWAVYVGPTNMTHNLVSILVLLAGVVIATLLSAVTLVAFKLWHGSNRRAVRLLMAMSTVLLYVISPLAFDTLVLSIGQRQDITYTAVDLAWWVGLTPSLYAIVIVALVQILRRRRHSARTY